MTFGDRVKERREELGLTLLQLAEKIGVSSATVQRYECGRIKTPRMPQLKALAKALSVDTNYLLGLQQTDVTPNADSEPREMKLTAREQIFLAQYRNMPDSERRSFWNVFEYIGQMRLKIHKLELRAEIVDRFLDSKGLSSDAEDYLDKDDDWKFLNE